MPRSINHSYTNKTRRRIQLSQLLTWILRHGAHVLNLPIASDGYILFDELLKHPKFDNFSQQDIIDVAKMDKKDVYNIKLENERYYIKANFGHSLKEVSDLSIDKIIPVLVCCSDEYTTTFDIDTIYYPSVLQCNKKYVYFINMKETMKENIIFYQRNNYITCSSEIKINHIGYTIEKKDIDTELCYCSGFIVLKPLITGIETVLIENHNSTYSYPKGKRKGDELILETALRELYEETGISVGDIEITVKIVKEISTPNYPTICYYLAYLKKPVSLVCDPLEMASVNWYTIKRANELLNQKRREILNSCI